ncbi:CHAP domain [Trypanosoma melophagium]|uniref:CHAP domain n=1 Tax=Trypanosoma melophagium TaxID=715481 RepID=UPI00351A6701|nr:CHAP domain [Trypanosoma melophagium]
MQRETELSKVSPVDKKRDIVSPKEEENVTLPANETAVKVELQEDSQSKWKERISRATPILSAIIGWTLCVLVVLFLAFNTFGILYSGIHYHGEKWHEEAKEQSKCGSPFGSIIGVHNDVFAYSNGNETYISDSGNTLSNTKQSRTGLKWQCVEYARRYWMLRGSPLPATFAAVEGAADIWALQSVQLEGGTKTPLLKYPNGVSLSAGGSAPLVGDLLIYPRQKGGFMYGHVAVIVGVTDTDVLVAEQNWDNTAWPGPYHNYSRAIPMLYDAKKQSYTLNEPDGIIIQGWIRYRM